MATVLVIEDDTRIQLSIAGNLRMEGFDVHVADDGATGVAAAQAIHPDVIICDIMMPGMDGYEVLDVLRGDPATATVPFIFLTARTERPDVRQGMAQGADDYITKPFRMEELIDSVRARLDRYAALTRRMDELRTNLAVQLPHELVTPLNTIIGFSDLLLTEGEALPLETWRENVRLIHQAGQRLLSLTRRFMLYARLAAAALGAATIRDMQSEHCEVQRDLVVLIAHSVARLHGRAGDMVCQAEAAVLPMSEIYFTRLLEELIDNALKFSLAGTPVTVQGQLQDRTYLLSIVDQGRGMTAGQIATIGAYMQFERRTYEQQGIGLGLAIVHQIADLHGGHMEVESRPEAGTRVRVSFPVA